MAHNIQTEYEMFRQVRRESPLEEDNLSAQYSVNESYPDFQDRAQTNSARSMPGGDKIDQLQHQLLVNMRQNQELNQKNSFLEQEHRLLQGKYQLLEQKLTKSENENRRLSEQARARKERQKGTKGKLKEWVDLAKQNLNQI